MIRYDDDLMLDLAPKKASKKVKILLGFLTIMLIIALYFYYLQITRGLIITNMNDYFSWGIYTSNFIFFVSISFVGSLTGSFLRMGNFHWRIPVVRITEIVAVIALIMASVSIVLDMGRPDRLFNMIIYGRIQSPIIWDVFIVSSYFVISMLLLYLSLIPDFAILKNFCYDKPRLRKAYTVLAINWKATREQRKLRNKARNIITALIVPISLLHQTSNGWLFATTYRVGWNSAAIGPYFITGAVLVGFAVIILFMYTLRYLNKLYKYITPYHFEKMSIGMGVASVVYLYFSFSIYVLPLYAASKNQQTYTNALFTGEYALMFWTVFIGTSIIPTMVLFVKKWRKPKPLLYISIILLVTSWFKRYLIIIPTLQEPFLPKQGTPENWLTYTPSFMEGFIALTTFTTSLLLIALFVRFIPVIGIHDYAITKRLVERENKEIENKEIENEI